MRNQLVKTFTSAATVENRYNGEGYRVEKKVNGAITRYLYEYDKVVLETDGAGQQTGRNVYGTSLLMRTADGTSYYYMYNGHADVTALLRPDGSIAATYYYDAFGNITDTTGSASNSITYAGYQYDKETGLYYLNARMYDPKTARFVQEDTYRGEQNDPLSLNLYTYCSNEPLMYTDPTGHISLSWFKDKIQTKYNDLSTGAKKLGKKVVKKAGEAWDYVSDKAVEAWDTSTGYVAEKASEAYTSLKNDAKAVKQWAKTQATNTKEGFTTLTNSKKRKEAFELIDTYGSESDKILARVAAGTALVAGTTAVAATAVYAAPLIATAGASVTTSIMASSAATFAVANAEAVAWGTVGLVGGGVAVKSDIENKEYGQIPMDLATAVLGGLMLKGTASSYRSTVGMKPNVGVNGGSRLKLNYQQFADDAGASEVIPKGKTFVDLMEPAEVARYERYWKQNYKSVFEGQPNTRQRTYTTPGNRSIIDQKINEKTGGLYSRETIYDEYGRRIGNNDFTDHARPDVPSHTNPHYHPNPWKNPDQHGPATPGLHPDTPKGGR